MKFMKILLLLSLITSWVFSLLGCAGSDTGNNGSVTTNPIVSKFANLDASQVVSPAAISYRTASGSLTVDTTTGVVSGSVMFRPIFGVTTSTTRPVTSVQVREGTQGTNGDIVLTLTAFQNGLLWRVPPGTALTPAQMSTFAAGNFYFSSLVAHPDGEIRGQINASPPTGIISFESELSGLQEVTPVTTNASGICNISTNTSTGAISGGLEIFPLPASSVTSVKVYEGSWGTNGKLFVDMTGSGGLWGIPTGTVLTPAQIISFSAGNFYINVQTVAHPEGELRGQIDNNGGAPIPAKALHGQRVQPGQ